MLATLLPTAADTTDAVQHTQREAEQVRGAARSGQLRGAIAAGGDARPMKEKKSSAAPAGTSPGATKPPVFEVTSVEKVDAPEGGHGRNWYRYVLKSHCSTITGQRQGSRQFVHDYAVKCAEQLNARAASCQSIWNPRGRKPASRSR